MVIGMWESSGDKIPVNMIKAINALMLAVFLPVMFCVLFIGNKMDYFDDVKADILVPNALLTLAALPALGIALWMLRIGRKFRLEGRRAWCASLVLAGLFIGFYYFCLATSNESVFNMAVDPGIVRDTALEVARGTPLGYRFEFSIDHNNIPITYIVSRIYRLANSWKWFAHTDEYLGVIVGCLAVSIAGFICCEIVKKLTKNPAAVLITFGLYLLTAGLCPWKYIPYTDSYVIPFPALCLLLYLYGRDCKHIAGRGAFYFLSMLSGVAGGFIKPNAYIVVVAVLGLEAVHCFMAIVHWARNRKAGAKEKGAGEIALFAGISLILGLSFFGLFYRLAGSYKEYMIQAMGLEYNEELEKTVQYCFFFSTNEATTGSFTIEDYSIFGEFQLSKADRNAACMERAWARIRQRGVGGTIYFCLKKLVKSFNDGSFAWTDVRYWEPFPEDLTHDNRIGRLLRALFVPGQHKQGQYDTFAEWVWILILLGVPGIVLEKPKEGQHTLFVVVIIGVLFYLMLFESGARYLYIFLPVFATVSVCGMEFMGDALARLRGRQKS